MNLLFHEDTIRVQKYYISLNSTTSHFAFSMSGNHKTAATCCMDGCMRLYGHFLHRGCYYGFSEIGFIIAALFFQPSAAL